MTRIATIFLIAGALGTHAFATSNSCGTGGGSGQNTYSNPTTAITLSTANGVDANDVGNNAGCQIINRIYDNFAVASSVTNNPYNGSTPTMPTDTTINLLGTWTNPTELLTFSGVGTAWNNNVIDTSPPTRCDNGGESATGDCDMTWQTTIDFTARYLSNRTIGIQSVSLSLANFDGTDAMSLQILVCNNAVLSPATVCTTGTSFFNQTYTATGNTTNFGATNFSAVQNTNLAISFIVTLKDGSANGINLQNFSVGFADTPEPSTWGMMGSALVGMGFLARRRKKSS